MARLRGGASYVCDSCGSFVDAGELIGGICLDCREEERALEPIHDRVLNMRKRMVEQNDGQMVMLYGR